MASADQVLDQAIAALEPLRDAGSGRSLLELQWIRQVRVQNNRVVFRLALPGFAGSQRERIAAEARSALLALGGIDDVQIELAQPSEAAPAKSQAPGHSHDHSHSHSHGGAPIGAAGHGGGGPERQAIPGVKQVIAVSSGKGGVGKSTVAVNLACALAAGGLRVGLLDADIYGPNAPTMLGVADRTPEVRGEGAAQVLTPIESCGIAMVSMGLLIQENQPVIWRGPMLNGIIRQFLYQVEWGERDVLVVDLPPGTGDAQLSLAQAVPMAGVVIVTTPQQVSLQDARRGLAMFLQMGVPVLGVVENMTAFIPPDAPEKRYELFGRGGGQRLAEEAGVPLLAQLPMELAVVQGGDGGSPAVLSAPESATAQAFRALAERLLSAVPVA
ncbi:Mrp/NBP35 family ATP-binding protein [Vulcanococcus limneticus Candia 3F8]|uniref:Mrp/NBP35 family ATP-binding protein n=1 Tax=Vulcanococcus limneticus TaxID=2170428 RepID=UPI000B99114F|nr:Mrp/NBP35 family ATP-binding protein [Vulcanococcus limneticus]MCP9793185.1 Mrp/NBP35 family ATP-binding protein [Vulcanococcus limneticus MW73D5]MCP9895191.1 Mrp/NBP35 family ATP-binding protein [Vulcanococcus limneticus Candia 3F8]MCP9898583.1 Mrp/NBP35 family ATP-binding protein [Vulcanococcus limneticus Candia 3B3]